MQMFVDVFRRPPVEVLQESKHLSFLEAERNPIKRFWLLLGPGLITGAADDDPSGIATYSMAGAAFGFSTLWTALFTFPMMTVVQYICAKIGMVTGMGLTDVLRIHYPRKYLYPAVIALFIANSINAGADIGAMAAGINLLLPQASIPFLIVPITGVLLALQIFGTYKHIARIFKWLALALFAYVATALFVRIDLVEVLRGTFMPTLRLDQSFLSTLVAILGTTISPYLFFWQVDQEVEEEIRLGHKHLWQRQGTTERELRNRGLDVVTGMFFSNFVMYFIILTTGATLFKAGHYNISSAAEAAAALRPLAGEFASLLFALGIVGTGFLAIPILTSSASYAVAQALGLKHGLSRKFVKAKGFYLTIAVSMLIGMLINYLGINALDALFWTAVLNGVLAPFMLVLVMLVSNNEAIMGNYKNGSATNIVGWLTTLAMFGAAIGLFLSTKH
jgi:NRAMP (natural resistance-associated macrophage protein)-like metal ion transporter